MRVLATWDPEVLPALHDALSVEESAAMGALPDVDAPDWFAMAFDPRGECAEPDDIGCSYFLETVEGIHTKRHPEAILRDSPRLWDVVGRWRSGVTRDISRADYAELDNFELECWLTLLAASNREQERRWRRKDPDGP